MSGVFGANAASETVCFENKDICFTHARKMPGLGRAVSKLKQPMDLEALSDFNLVATHGGFGRASRATGRPKAALSRRVTDLE